MLGRSLRRRTGGAARTEREALREPGSRPPRKPSQSLPNGGGHLGRRAAQQLRSAPDKPSDTRRRGARDQVHDGQREHREPRCNAETPPVYTMLTSDTEPKEVMWRVIPTTTGSPERGHQSIQNMARHQTITQHWWAQRRGRPTPGRAEPGTVAASQMSPAAGARLTSDGQTARRPQRKMSLLGRRLGGCDCWRG